jgi:hypothetical protein
MKLNLVIGNRRRIGPCNEPDAERLSRLPRGTLLPVSIRQPRNAQHHRKFFALLTFIADNHPRFKTVDDVLLELKIRAHHYREHITLDGEVVFVPKSIAFEEMEQHDFDDFYRRCVDAATSDLLPAVPPHVLNAYIEEAARFA